MKEKISVSIDAGILREVDSRIDGAYVKNRSQAVEMVLRELLPSSVNDAVILAGGRMSRQILENMNRQIAMLCGAGIKNIIIMPGGNYAGVFSSIGDGSGLGADIRYINEKKKLGTAGALKLAEARLGCMFVLVYADIKADVDVSKMIDYHRKSGSRVTAAVVPVDQRHSTDMLVIEGKNVERFSYNPAKKGMMNMAGIYVMSGSVLDMLPAEGSLEKDVLPLLAERGELVAYNFSGVWGQV